MWKKSLKGRLTLYIVPPVMLTLLAIGGVGFHSAYNEAKDIYDTELSHLANLMLSLLRAEDQEEAARTDVDKDKEEKINPDILVLSKGFENMEQGQESRLDFRIWKNDKLLFQSQQASDFEEERVIAGFSNQIIRGKEWRFYVLPDAKSGYTLEVAQKSKVRMLLINKVLDTIFSPLILLLPIILIVTWIGLRTGLKPLLAVSDAVNNRSALDLTPLPTCHSLAEIKPLVASINELLTNLDYALKKERRFTDFAAHELRTPITIFKTQAQTALKATDDSERRVILEAQVQAANRAANLVDQLLTLARLEHTDIPTESLSINDIAREIVEERLPLAGEKKIALQFKQEAVASIHGNKELLAIILSNLIDNAVKYTPEHGNVIVSVSMQGQTANLSVCDNGPGIPEDKLPYVTERFYRVYRNQQQPGAGLGLTIVKRAAEIMGATLILQNKGTERGFECVLQFSDSI